MSFNPENDLLNLADILSREKFVLARYRAQLYIGIEFPGLNFGDLSLASHVAGFNPDHAC